jgi:hypothetical protein
MVNGYLVNGHCFSLDLKFRNPETQKRPKP